MGGGGEEETPAHLKGLARYFNSETLTGRANVAKATYAVMALGIGYLVYRRWNKPQVVPQQNIVEAEEPPAPSVCVTPCPAPVPWPNFESMNERHARMLTNVRPMEPWTGERFYPTRYQLDSKDGPSVIPDDMCFAPNPNPETMDLVK